MKDVAGNEQWYHSKDVEYREDGAKMLPHELSFIIKDNAEADENPPKLIGVSLDKTEVEAPGVITVTAEATDDISGADEIYLSFKSVETKSSYNMIIWREKSTGKFTKAIEISQYAKPGVYTLETVLVKDVAGNEQWYHSKDVEYREEGDRTLPHELSFIIRNGDGTEFITSTANPQLADDIRAQPDGQKIIVNYGTGSQISGDLFDAIKGSNKTLVFESGGIQWEFNGKDIGTTKPLDLKVAMDAIDHSSSNNIRNIKEIVQGTPTMVLSFAQNGKLPGIAKIRIKADYTFRNYLGGKNLYVYYYDRQANKLVLVAQDIKVSDDQYLTFEIDHNSDYIITKDKVRLSNNSNSSGSGGGGSGGGSRSRGGRGGSLGGSSAAVAAAIPNTPVDVTVSAAFNAAQAAVKAAKASGWSVAIAQLQNAGDMPLDALKAMVEAAGMPIRLNADSMHADGKGVEVRLTLDPSKATKAVNLAASTSNSAVQTCQSFFERFFSNKISVVSLQQRDSFGQSVEIVTKVNPELNTKALMFYSYNKDMNTCTRIAHSNHWVDINGYIHFTTVLAGDIVITDKPLARK